MAQDILPEKLAGQLRAFSRYALKRRPTLVVLGVSLAAYVTAVVWPTQDARRAFIQTYGAFNSTTLQEPLAWLTLAAFLSLISVYAVNVSSAFSAGKVLGLLDKKLHKRASHYIYPSYAITALVSAVLIILLYRCSEVLFQFDLLSQTKNALPLGKIQDTVYMASILTGPLYIFMMTINDIILYALSHTIRDDFITPEMPFDNAKNLRVVGEELSIYGSILVYVDIPILLGLGVILAKEKWGGIDNEIYIAGFVGGTVAMHVILANLISVIIEFVTTFWIETHFIPSLIAPSSSSPGHSQ